MNYGEKIAFLHIQETESRSESIESNISSSFCSHFNLERSTDHNMTKIEPYLSLRKLFSAFLSWLLSVGVIVLSCYVCVFSGRKYKDENVFPVLIWA